ncbi:MAG: bifunctional oligoribonuclease/PAP phosphatase NrnA, partial [Candidatus Thorarchaeota archaeon]|nr:bifunctional oligoribonuclease/PAP phosphatase NrnA [Candidatus Thorarchaeota archaeon]
MNVRDLLSTTKEVLILGHHNADPDAVCAMVAFSHLYKALNPEGVTTLACDDISKLANQVLSKLAPDIQIVEETNRDYEFAVVLDTNSS